MLSTTIKEGKLTTERTAVNVRNGTMYDVCPHAVDVTASNDATNPGALREGTYIPLKSTE